MPDRDVDAFLAGTDWASATRKPLSGDASNRRYERLFLGDETAVLMDAPPDRGEDVRPFVSIASYLSGLGFSAPTILASDEEAGFLLLEDLGDDLYARVLERGEADEHQIYAAAVDLLADLHEAAPPKVESYTPGLMADLATLAFTKYRAGIEGSAGDEAAIFTERFERLLADHASSPQVLILRDYHAENLLWLPDRPGVARVGLLDFQDAMLGHPAYDLVSLLQDARRDVPAAIEAAMIERYLDRTGTDQHPFRTAYALLGVQRNLRILGVFARLGTEYGKPYYVDLIPRVWAHMIRSLEHPVLSPVADLLRNALPAPEPSALARLRG